VGATAGELLSAAASALAAGDYETALEAVDASIAADDTALGRQTRGGLYFMDDRFVEAQDEWQTAFRLARAAGQHQHAARAAISLARLHTGYNGLNATGRGWMERGRMALENVGPCVEWGYLELAVMACDRPDIDDLMESTRRALDIALEFGDINLEVQAMADRGLALVTRGAAPEGFALLDAVLAAISTGEIAFVAASICFCSMLTACDRAGDLSRAEEWHRVVAALIEGIGNKPHVLHTHCRLAYGSVLCAAGRWSEAESLLVDALGPADNPDLCHRALTVAHLASLRLDQGRVEEAAVLLAPFEDQITSCGPLARVHLRRGEPDLAVAVLERGLKELVGDRVRAAPLLALLTDAELQRGDVDAARTAAEELAEIAALSDLDSLRSEAALADARVLAALGDRPAATEAFATAKAHLADDRPFQLGLVRLELASLLSNAGDVPGALSEARAALACFERLGASTARDRAAAVLRELGDTGRSRPQDNDELTAVLTKREREVLELVSIGLTNAEIAERLFISAKTAEHHVGRVLAKLGVRSRAEAAALAVRLAATSRDG
jgi:DNA-binding CsgD family transcriptional regulator